MAYILITRDPHGSLRLLADSAFDSRQDALSELSRVTGSSSFTEWDSEVFLVDLAAATPVLLVRPAAALPMSEVVESAQVLAADDPAILQETEVDTDDADARLAEMEVLPVDDAAIADAIVEQSGGNEEVAPSASALPMREATGDELRAALRRTAEQMQSESVEVPDIVEISGEGTAGEQTQGETPPIVTPAVGTVPWPWDAAVGDTSPPDGAVADVPIDEVAASAEPAAELVKAQSPLSTDATETSSEEDGSGFGAPTAGAAAPPTTLSEAASDFILDLDQPASSQPLDGNPDGASLLRAVEPDVPSPDEYRCGDCAYVETCPNKDQRLPKDCGSFQWR